MRLTGDVDRGSIGANGLIASRRSKSRTGSVLARKVPLAGDRMRRAVAVWALVFALLCCLPARSADTFTLNAILSLTGSGAFLGQDQAAGYALVEQVVNASGGINGTIRTSFSRHRSGGSLESSPQAWQVATGVGTHRAARPGHPRIDARCSMSRDREQIWIACYVVQRPVLKLLARPANGFHATAPFLVVCANGRSFVFSINFSTRENSVARDDPLLQRPAAAIRRRVAYIRQVPPAGPPDEVVMLDSRGTQAFNAAFDADDRAARRACGPRRAAPCDRRARTLQRTRPSHRGMWFTARMSSLHHGRQRAVNGSGDVITFVGNRGRAPLRPATALAVRHVPQMRESIFLLGTAPTATSPAVAATSEHGMKQFDAADPAREL